MPLRASALALPLGILLAVVLAACGSGDADESGATLEAPPVATATTPATTAATTAPTTTTVTTPTTTATTPTTTAPATTTTATRPAGGATATQPSGGAPAGCPAAVGGFIRDVRATDCGVARQVASAWFDAVHDGAAPDGPVDAAGYACSGTLAGERADVTCSGARGSVSFTASP